jgi:hypothetical protein
MHPSHSPRPLTAAILLATAAAACSDTREPTAPLPDLRASAQSAPAPSPLATTTSGSAALELWPYTSDDFTNPKDPVNLLFVGNADPRSIRAALLSVSEDHSGFPLPFVCRWEDIPEGGIQSTYAAGTGWTGSAIQLACGDYAGLRFHLRLFAAGDWTIGAAHVEFLIPGTTEHQVLSWEVAEQFVTFDLYRSGVGGLIGSAVINDQPAFRTIQGQIVGLLASDPTLAPLLAIACPTGVQLPWACDGSTDVGILTDGSATILGLEGEVAAETGSFHRTSTVQFDQAIPKPFCVDAAFPFVHVNGPIELREHWVLTPSNNYIARFQARGRLLLTPVNPETGAMGESYTAMVYEQHRAMLTDRQNQVAQVVMQVEVPPASPFHGMLAIRFGVGPNGMASYDASLTCGG